MGIGKDQELLNCSIRISSKSGGFKMFWSTVKTLFKLGEPSLGKRQIFKTGPSQSAQGQYGLRHWLEPIQITFQFKRGDLIAIGLPFIALIFQHIVEDMLTESFSDQIRLFHELHSTIKAFRERLISKRHPLGV